jgi:hypothetical protein
MIALILVLVLFLDVLSMVDERFEVEAEVVLKDF